MEHKTHAYKTTIKKLPGSRIELEAVIPAEEFDATREKALTHIGSDVELPGFRKGHVPEKVLLARIGEGALLEEMAEMAISHAYPHIIVTEKIDALGRPDVHITKIAPGNPLEFTITTAVFPTYTLPDYKKIATKAVGAKEEVSVTDEDLEKTVNQIKRMHAEERAKESGVPFDDAAPLPDLDDAFIAKLGAFKNMDELTAALRENLLMEKTRDAKDKRRIAIMDAIVKETTIELPDLIIDQETLRMEDEFAQDIARMGLNIEGYLASVKKTKEELHKEWRPDAIKRATIQILIGKIADEEKLEADPVKLKEDTDALRARYPDADASRIESFVHMLLTNEKVFDMLESLSV